MRPLPDDGAGVRAGGSAAERARGAGEDQQNENPLTAGRFGIRSIPTLIKLDHGREVRRASGAVPAGQIVAFASA